MSAFEVYMIIINLCSVNGSASVTVTSLDSRKECVAQYVTCYEAPKMTLPKCLISQGAVKP
jgi:hypothetical protein